MITENRIVIVDDHPLFLDGLRNALLLKCSGLLVQSAGNYLELFSLLESEKDDIDLILMDLNMPGATNEAGIFYLRKMYPEIPMIILSAHDTIDVKLRCLQAGASDFLSKSIPVSELVHCVEKILEGSYQYPLRDQTAKKSDADTDKIALLSPSQFKVLHLISNGHANKTIADLLQISEKTVKNHISAIFEKLEVSNRTQASRLFLQSRS